MGRAALAAIAACMAGAVLSGDVESAGRTLQRSSWALRYNGPRLEYEQPFGRSAGGRKLVVSAFGTVRARHKVLAVGCIHGTECAGIGVVRRILDGCPPTNAEVWAVPDLNPDGHRVGTRVNGRGVDLNRNFSAGWHSIGAAGDPEYAGPRPFSERESRAARRLIRLVRPAVTIWYHQGQGPLVRAWGASVPAARQYARASGLPFRRMPWLAGTAPHWQNRTFPGTSSFVVELADGRLSTAQAVREAAAIELLAGYRGENRSRENRSQLKGSATEGR